MSTRIETDSLGEIAVPANALWGAQTQRSIENFPVGDQRMPIPLIRAFALVKKAAALTNRNLGKLDSQLADWIVAASDEVLDGQHDDQFPLVVWQTGSGTQSNMNANEVIANRASELGGGERGSKKPVHPNDHVNMSQSSNDFFPTAMHVASARYIHDELLPAAEALRDALAGKARDFADITKIGRTHMMDATPLTLGQEFSGYAAQIDFSIKQIRASLDGLYELALGGSAVGTGLNTHPDYADKVAACIADLSGLPFRSAGNKFMALSAHDAMLSASASLRQLASACMVIGNNIRLLGSGPRCGIGELNLPANEPGSSIMPGKVNPTQCEMLTQVAAQVIGLDTAIVVAGSQGHLQLNVFKPMMVFNLLSAARLLRDGCATFNERCVQGIEANTARIGMHLENSLMLVTALNPKIGYDKAAEVAKKAHAEGKTLKAVVLEMDLLSEAEFDDAVDPSKMTSP